MSNEKVVIEVDADNYQKSKSAGGNASRHNGDLIAATLAGLTLEEVGSIAAELLDQTEEDTRAKYAHLNVGQQRMNLGNRIRGVVNKMNKAIEANDAKAEDKRETGLVSGDNYLAEVASPFTQARDDRAVEAEAAAKLKDEEKEIKAQEKADKAEAAAKAKAEKAEAKAQEKADKAEAAEAAEAAEESAE